MLRRLLLAGCAALLCCAGRAGVALPPKWSAVLTRSGAIEPRRGHGFDTVGGARPGAVRFVHSCTIGIFDQKGASPVPA